MSTQPIGTTPGMKLHSLVSGFGRGEWEEFAAALEAVTGSAHGTVQPIEFHIKGGPELGRAVWIIAGILSQQPPVSLDQKNAMGAGRRALESDITRRDDDLYAMAKSGMLQREIAAKTGLHFTIVQKGIARAKRREDRSMRYGGNR